MGFSIDGLAKCSQAMNARWERGPTLASFQMPHFQLQVQSILPLHISADLFCVISLSERCIFSNTPLDHTKVTNFKAKGGQSSNTGAKVLTLHIANTSSNSSTAYGSLTPTKRIQGGGLGNLNSFFFLIFF